MPSKFESKPKYAGKYLKKSGQEKFEGGDWLQAGWSGCLCWAHTWNRTKKSGRVNATTSVSNSRGSLNSGTRTCRNDSLIIVDRLAHTKNACEIEDADRVCKRSRRATNGTALSRIYAPALSRNNPRILNTFAETRGDQGRVVLDFLA